MEAPRMAEDQPMKPSRHLPALLLALLLLSGCSMGTMVVRGSQSIMDSSVDAMNRETDLELVCPCRFKRQETWKKQGRCWCGLFVKE